MQTHAKFYALLSRMPGATKFGIVNQYTPTGSLSTLLNENKCLYARMLADMERTISGNFTAEADMWRKRVISSIAAFFRQQGRYVDNDPRERMDKIKSTATRIAKTVDFNAIPIPELRKIYNAFKHKQR